ncbi:MAG: helix-turn-helix domain-containing protein [Chlamydia suis]|nr:helix-turn-helix domain-containing protein [Chlamydia suis]
MLQLYKKGESAKDIATKMGRSPSAIRSRLRKLQRAC